MKSLLASTGISAFVPDEMSTLDGPQLGFGGFRIQVAEDEAAAARALLDSFKGSKNPAESDGLSDGNQSVLPD